MRKFTVALLIALTMVTAASASTKPEIVRPGFQYASYVDDDCSILIHDKDTWRPWRELHVACTLKAGAGPDGVTLKYVYPKSGKPTAFGAVIEDRTHGQYGDIPFIRAWQSKRDPRVGYIHIPGPIPEHENGIYVHVEHVYWNSWSGVREDHA